MVFTQLKLPLAWITHGSNVAVQENHCIRYVGINSSTFTQRLDCGVILSPCLSLRTKAWPSCPSLLLSQSPTAHRCETQSHIVNTRPAVTQPSRKQRGRGELVTRPSWTSPLSLSWDEESEWTRNGKHLFSPPYCGSSAQLFQMLQSLAFEHKPVCH